MPKDIDREPGGSRPMERKAFPFEMKQLDIKRGSFSAYVAIFGLVDLDRDIIDAGAFTKTLKENRSRPKFKGFPVQRNHHDLIGISEKETEDKKGLLIDGRITPDVVAGHEALILMDQGILNGWSFQFRTINAIPPEDSDDGFRHLTELAYFEGGPVDIPAQPETFTVSLKAATGWTKLPHVLAELGVAWNRNAAVTALKTWAGGPDKAEIDWSRYGKGFLWFDKGNSQSYGGYDFPVADIFNGEIKAVPRAVFAAAGRISGRVDIPEGDIAGIKTTINKYYSLMGRTPPWERSNILDADESLGLLTDGIMKMVDLEGFDIGSVSQLQSCVTELKALVEPSVDIRQAALDTLRSINADMKRRLTKSEV